MPRSRGPGTPRISGGWPARAVRRSRRTTGRGCSTPSRRALERAAAGRPHVVVLEDLHWADASSLALLRHVAGALGRARVLVVLTHRAGDAAAPFAGAETIALRGLAQEDVRRLLPPGADSAATAAVVHRRTNGNPFFAHELARVLETERGGRALLEAVPGTVREVVGRRVDALSAPAQRALEVGAVLGRPFGVGVLARLMGGSPSDAADALDEALAAELLVEAAEYPGRHDFPHAIVRDALYGRLSRRERTRLHAAAADLLRAGAGGDVTAADVAHHSLLAARGGVGADAAWADALAAAREAEAVLAHAEARAHYEQALEAGELGAAPGDRAPPRGAGRAGGGLPRRGRRPGLAPAPAAGGGARPPAAATPAALAEAALGFAHLQAYGEVDHDAIALLQEALDAQAPEDSELRARLLAVLALRTDPVEEQERREALVQDAVAMAARLGDDRTAITAQLAAGMVEWRPERVAARRAAVDAVLRLTARHPRRRRGPVGRAPSASPTRCAGATRGRSTRSSTAAPRSCGRPASATTTGGCRSCARAARIHAGRLAEAERADRRPPWRPTGTSRTTPRQEATPQRLVLETLRWRPRALPLEPLRGYAARHPRLPVWEAMVAAAEWARGDAARGPPQPRRLPRRRRRRHPAHAGLARLPGHPRRSRRRAWATNARCEELLAAAGGARRRQPVLRRPLGGVGPRGARRGPARRRGRRARARGRALRGRRWSSRSPGPRRPGSCGRPGDWLRSARAGARPRARSGGACSTWPATSSCRGWPRASATRSADHAVALLDRVGGVPVGEPGVAVVGPVRAPRAAQEEVPGP